MPQTLVAMLGWCCLTASCLTNDVNSVNWFSNLKLYTASISFTIRDWLALLIPNCCVLLAMLEIRCLAAVGFLSINALPLAPSIILRFELVPVEGNGYTKVGTPRQYQHFYGAKADGEQRQDVERASHSRCGVPTVPAQTYELKSGLIHLLPKFHGLAGEDPHKHLKEFHVVCSTMRPQGILEDYIKMKAFPFSLDGAAKDWLYL
ncbi:hypothetical protein CR513_02824, partial [Mucuna pruriens]